MFVLILCCPVLWMLQAILTLIHYAHDLSYLYQVISTLSFILGRRFTLGCMHAFFLYIFFVLSTMF